MFVKQIAVATELTRQQCVIVGIIQIILRLLATRTHTAVNTVIDWDTFLHVATRLPAPMISKVGKMRIFLITLQSNPF